MVTLRGVLGGVLLVLVVSGNLPTTLSAQQTPPRPQSSGSTRLSSEQVLQLSLAWVDFLAVLADVRALGSDQSDIGQMLINNRYSVNKLKSPLLLGGLIGEPPYPKDSPEEKLIESLLFFKDQKLAEADKAFALLRRLSEATTAADIKTVPGDLAIFAGEADALWNTLPLSSVLLMHILVDNTRIVDDRTPYLRLTSQQIATLKQRLKQVFPAISTTNGGANGSAALEFSASMVYNWFLNSGYKAADAK